MSPGVFHFGPFELDPENFELRRAGRRIKLDRTPLELLLLLVRRAGKLVTHEEAIQEVWGKDIFIETDSAVYTAIRKVRRALGDNLKRPRFIETVARKGYRFIALHAAQVAHAAAPEEGDAPKRVILAVLPLENLSGDSRHEYFSDGLTEELISELGRFSPQEMGVIARTSAMRYKRTRKGAAQICAELGADFLIEGSARHERGRVRITLQLIRASDQSHVWAESFERPLGHVLRVQEEVGKAVAERIRLKLAAALPARSAVDPEVYDLYLRGRYLWDQRTAPAIQQAIHHFERALVRDSAYAPAWAGLAMCYAMLAITSDFRPADSFPHAQEASDRALALDWALPEAHVSRGIVHFWFDWNWEAAEREFRHACELNPSDSGARMYLAHLHSNLARHVEAISEIRAARRLDPLSHVVNTHEGHFLYNARRYAEAAAPLERVLELAPRFWVAHIVLGKLLGVRSGYRQALGEFAKAQRYSFGNTEAVGLRGYTLGMMGNERGARRTLRELELRSRRHYVPQMHRALVLLGLGEHRAVFEALENAVGERDVRLTFLAVEPRWDSLRAKPQFESIRKQVGLPRTKISTHK
ncbi:MAG: winged helix-turn-helix domain-containing protein [Candidatus Acidiferrales bacterium]